MLLVLAMPYYVRTRRKRVVKLPDGREIDFGVWDLRDFIQPRCNASTEIYVGAFSRLVSEFDSVRDLVNKIGLHNVLVKYAWNIVNVEVKYRYDDPVFNVPDYWLLANETWSQRHGDCEDSSFLLESVIEHILEIDGSGDPSARSYAVIGYYYDGQQYYGHAWVLYRSDKIVPKDRWAWIETTLEEEVPQHIWFLWRPEDLVPVYWFNSRESYRILEDYEVLGLDEEYIETHRGAIDAMIAYVETGKRLKVKWMHKGRRTPKVVETIYVA